MKAGYKQTEVGVIPEDWGQLPFGELYAEPSRNGIYKTSEHRGRGIPIVNMGEMFGLEFIADQEMKRVKLTAQELSVNVLKCGDLLFGRRSVVPSGAGKCSIVQETSEPTTFESSIIRVRLDHKKSEPLFFYYFFASPVGRALMAGIIAGTNIKGIKGTELRELCLSQPILKEQKAIAGALSDVDGLIAGLEALIAKKRSLKTATMQQLLTGKTRLPGFDGDWTKREFGELATIRNQKVNTFRNVLSKSCVELEQIQSGTGRVSRFEDASNRHTSKYSFTAGDVLFGRLRPYLAKYFLASQNGVCSTEIWPLIGTGATQLFLYQLVQSQGFIDAASEAYGTHMPRADWKILRVLHMAVPLDLAEQDAIGGVLFDMEFEITALIEKLAKAKALKQGMMQELLTGRTRLI